VPKGLGTVTPFVHAKGAPEYIEFLKRAFGAVEEVPRDIIGGVVRFARLRIGNAAIELGEAEPSTPPMPGAFYLNVSHVDRLYEEAVAAGARPLSPPAGGERGATLAHIEDPIGNHWLIATPA
jgi:PhnB protein